MKHALAISTLLVSTLVATADAGPIVFDGLQHIPLGNAALLPGANLEVCNIGSSGLDGVSVDLGESEFLLLELDGLDPGIEPPGLSTTATAIGMIGGIEQPIVHLSRTVIDPQLIQYFADFSPIGGMSVTAEVYDGDVLVDSQSGIVGPAAVVVGPTTSERLDPWWEMQDTGWAIVEFPALMTIGLTGHPPVQGDKLVMKHEGPPPPFEFLTEMQVTGNSAGGPDICLTVLREALGMFGLPHHVLGQAVFEPGLGELTLSNIGASGKDGVRTEVGGVESYTVQTQFTPAPAGSMVQFGATGRAGGVSGIDFGTLTCTYVHNGTVDWELNPDYSSIGSPTQYVRVFLGDIVVHEEPANHEPICVDCNFENCYELITQCDKKKTDLPDSNPPISTACFFPHFREPVEILFNGAQPGQGVMGDGIAILAETPAAEFEALESFSIVLTGYSSFTMLGEIATTVDVPGELDGTPAAFTLGPAFPNPMRSSTAIRYVLMDALPVSTRIFDVAGRLVWSREVSRQAAGRHEIIWDGRAVGGRGVAPGVYYYQVKAGATSRTHRLTVLR